METTMITIALTHRCHGTSLSASTLRARPITVQGISASVVDRDLATFVAGTRVKDADSFSHVVDPTFGRPSV